MKNLEIYEACNGIRLFILLELGWFFDQFEEGLKNNRQKLEAGSLISNLINEFNWKKLFKNKDWLRYLNFLEQDIGLLMRGDINNYLWQVRKNVKSFTAKLIKIQTTKRAQGEEILVDTSYKVCRKFGFFLNQRARNPNGLIVTFKGVAPGNDGYDVMWYVIEKVGTQGLSEGKACYWGEMKTTKYGKNKGKKMITNLKRYDFELLN